MQHINWMAEFTLVVNYFWWFTMAAMVVLYVVCNLLPDTIVGNILPLHIVFRPRTNVDLDFQSIGYAMLHTKWIARITHYTIIIDSMLWFVIFQSWHPSLPVIALSLIAIQALFIGDKLFGLAFILMGLALYATSVYIIQIFGLTDTVLFAKVFLMTGGVVRMMGHSVELMPPLLLEKSDKFVKLTPKTINWKIPVVAVIGCIAEFSSALPTRLLPVQINFLYQRIFGITPQTTMPWNQIEVSAKAALTGGYSQLEVLKNYYSSVTKGG
jgi:hypothetical protein